MKRKTKEETTIKVGDKVELYNYQFVVVGLWANDIAVIENNNNRYTVKKSKLKKI